MRLHAVGVGVVVVVAVAVGVVVAVGVAVAVVVVTIPTKTHGNKRDGWVRIPGSYSIVTRCVGGTSVREQKRQ